LVRNHHAYPVLPELLVLVAGLVLVIVRFHSVDVAVVVADAELEPN
jgi:hypothetical protein